MQFLGLFVVVAVAIVVAVPSGPEGKPKRPKLPAAVRIALALLSQLTAPVVRPAVEWVLGERMGREGRALLGERLSEAGAALARDDVAGASEVLALAIGGFKL